MAIISFTNPKGGSGKTTSVILLATELAHRGYKVAVVDADPEQHTSKWANRVDAEGSPTLPENIAIKENVVPDDLVDVVFDAQEEGADFVIVDPQGKADDVQASAISISDLVLIPVADSTMDQESSHKPIRRIRQEARKGREVKHAVLFTQVPRVKHQDDESVDLRTIRADFERDGVPIFPRKIHERAAIKKLNRLGGDLYSLKTYGITDTTTALQTAQDFADAVLAYLTGQDIQLEYEPTSSEEV